MFIWQVTKPVHEIDGLGFTAIHRKITGMDNHIGFGQTPKPMVTIVGIRKMQNPHLYLHLNMRSETFFNISLRRKGRERRDSLCHIP